MRRTRRIAGLLAALALLFGLCPSALCLRASAAAQVYYTIDFSDDVMAAGIGQRVANDCAVVSMATIESYFYGATTQDEKNQVYSAVVTANRAKNYAQWSYVGYVLRGYGSCPLSKLYEQLAMGYPVIVHRTETSGDEHWSVVCGYVGATDTLEESGFLVVNVGFGGGSYGSVNKQTLTEWRKGGRLNYYACRENGLNISGFSGVRFSVNHPAVVQSVGTAFSPRGRVVSDSELTAVRVWLTRATDGTVLYSSVAAPNAASYRLSELDGALSTAALPVGGYYYVIGASDASGKTAYHVDYFTVSDTWPATAPELPVYAIEYDLGDVNADVESDSVTYFSYLTLPDLDLQREGYLFRGWSVQRSSDLRWDTTAGWQTDTERSASGAQKTLYASGSRWLFHSGWLTGGSGACTYTFHAEWEPHTHSYADVVTAPTCTEAGYTTHTCTGCGDSYVDSHVAALGHSYVDYFCEHCNAELNCPSAAYSDLDTARWYHAGVDFVLRNGYMGGTGDGTSFSPDMALTREMLAQILYAEAGKPDVELTARFADEDIARWYAAAIEWAAEQGYITGYGNGNFGVGDAVTREQIAVILYAYENRPETDGDALTSYSDAGAVSGWARAAMAWAVENGLITGNEKGELMPQNEATRATFAVIFRAYLTKN